MTDPADINNYLAYWTEVLAGRYSSRELQQMWRVLNREFREGGINDLPLVIERLRTGEPFDYVLGHSEFYGLSFRVDPSVLIPRPETEELVEWVLSCRQQDACRVLDIGTGSGCIAVALASRRPRWEVQALDISGKALELATENAASNGAVVTFFQLDILDDMPEGRFDIIVSNPPYIDPDESGRMGAGTLQFEPQEALFTGSGDPFQFYDRIAALATSILEENGDLFFELNEFRARAIQEVIEARGLTCEVRKDLQGKQRMLRAGRPSAR